MHDYRESNSHLDDYLTLAEAAARRGVARTTVYDAIKAGKLPAIDRLGKTLLLVVDVDTWQVRPNARRSSNANHISSIKIAREVEGADDEL